MDMINDFADNITELMFDNKMDVKSFSNKLDIGLSECYRVLRKENLPTFRTIIKIADYFECSIDFLLGLSPHLSDYKLNYTPPFNIAFAQILNEYGITRYQLNKHTKIANSRIDDWYHGRRLPSLENIIKLSQYFDCSLDTLLAREYK